MTETSAPTQVTTETTASSPLVSHPITQSKPYDDDLINEYVNEEKAVEQSGESQTKEEPKDETIDPSAEKAIQDPPKGTKADKVVDGVEELPVKKVIGGKEVEFKIKDAVNAYIKQEEFNRNMDRRLSHVSSREKAWEKSQAEFKDKVGKIIESAQSGDFVQGIRALAKLAIGNSDADIVEFEKKYFEQLDKVRDIYGKMTPEQREAYFAKRSSEEARTRLKQIVEERQRETEKATLEQRIQTLQKEYAIDNSQFWENYKLLAESQVGDGKVFNTVHDIKPEDVVKFSLQVRHEEKIQEAGKKLGIEDESILEEVSRITSADPSLTVEDIVNILEKSGVVKTATPAQVENLNRKAEKSNTRFSQASTTKKNSAVEGLDREDLDYLYRKQPKVFTRVVR